MCDAAAAAAQEGDVQLFGLEDAGLLDNMPVEGDSATAAAALAGEPYLLLGCASGALRVAALLGPLGQPAEPVKPLASMELKPYVSERAYHSFAACLLLARRPLAEALEPVAGLAWPDAQSSCL